MLAKCAHRRACSQISQRSLGPFSSSAVGSMTRSPHRPLVAATKFMKNPKPKNAQTHRDEGLQVEAEGSVSASNSRRAHVGAISGETM
mmetsp:Transcript_24876/g.72894  ORF Transcript_24876/g.72894 Transcript_24876/m.72894 type:complete len:88 (-) Transcript_24876:603-866(-)